MITHVLYKSRCGKVLETFDITLMVVFSMRNSSRVHWNNCSWHWTTYILSVNSSTQVRKIVDALMNWFFGWLSVTDIKADNILSQIEDKSILTAFTKAEMEHPSPRKTVNGVTIYASRQLDVPKFFGDSVLSDFGSAVRGDEKRNHNASPQVYRVRRPFTPLQFTHPPKVPSSCQ